MDSISAVTIGAALLFAAYKLLQNRLTFLRNAQKASATVTVEQVRDSRGDAMYKPTYHYTTASKEAIRFESRHTSRKNTWENISTIDIFYDAANPQKMIVLSYWQAFGFVIALTAVGLISLLTGISIFLSQILLHLL